MSKIILIVGPTGTGKTTLSIKLAKKCDAVILNADSTQVYTEPLIATAKIKEHEKENIEHYLFDVVSLNDDYTLYDYQKDGRRLLDRFISENKNVIIVGGSGLYVKALLYNYVLEDKKEIARAFNIPSADIMESWFHTLSHLRNLCAHHNRIWNRNFGVFAPSTLDTISSHLTKKFTLYSRLVPLRYISNNIFISNGMTERLQHLFSSAPSIVTLDKMGFTTDWDQSDLWKCH